MKTTVKIQNLKCHGCASTITSKLSELENIKNVSVDVENDTVAFNYNSDNDLEQAKQKLQKLGYPLVGEQNKFKTKAKSYVSCAVGRMNK